MIKFLKESNGGTSYTTDKRAADGAYCPLVARIAEARVGADGALEGYWVELTRGGRARFIPLSAVQYIETDDSGLT